MLAKLVYFGIQNCLIISLKELNSFINISAVLKKDNSLQLSDLQLC